MPQADAGPAAGLVSAGESVPDVRPHRGVPVDLSRPVGGGPATRIRSAKPFRMPRSWLHDRTARGADQARRASWFTEARSSALGYWNDPVRTAERFRQPAPGSASDWRSPELAVWSGDAVVADEEGFLYFVGRKDEMIKTSGYRVSPTEIEEVAYDSGLVRDAVALGIEDTRLGHKIALLVTPADGGAFEVKELLACHAASSCRCTWCRRRSPCATSCPVPERKVRPQPAQTGTDGMTAADQIAAFGTSRRRTGCWWNAPASTRGPGGVDALLRVRPQAARRTGCGAARRPARAPWAELRDEGQPDAGDRAAPVADRWTPSTLHRSAR